VPNHTRHWFPNTTQTPNYFLDHLAPHLTEAELRVLLYVIRRTYGFQKHGDHISLSQLIEGIRRGDGSQLDEGTGLSKPSVLRGIKGLEERGILIVHRTPRQGKKPAETSYYTLAIEEPDSASGANIEGSSAKQLPGSEPLPRVVAPATNGVVAQSNQQDQDQDQEPKEDTEGVKRRLADLYRLLPQAAWERTTTALHRGDPDAATLRARVESAISEAKRRR
jgi:DNA-binding transcriptional ArsR family regulator